jgi:catechol 2,3-dioxygenase-like lactoylglutathione lyase family enzyme
MHKTLFPVLALTVGVVVGYAAASQELKAQSTAKWGASFTHIGLIVPDVDKASKEFAAVFGLEPRPANEFTAMVYPADYKGDPKGHPKTVSYRIGDNLSVELLQPVGGKSPWRDFLDSTSGVGGLHHIAFSAKGIDAYMAALKQHGGVIEFGGSASVTPQNYAYVNMRPRLGFTIELNGPPQP